MRPAFIRLCFLASAALVILSGGALLSPNPLISQIYRGDPLMAILAGVIINPRPIIVSLIFFGINVLMVSGISLITHDLKHNTTHRS
jgi:hypothetical protein